MKTHSFAGFSREYFAPGRTLLRLLLVVPIVIVIAMGSIVAFVLGIGTRLLLRGTAQARE